MSAIATASKANPEARLWVAAFSVSVLVHVWLLIGWLTGGFSLKSEPRIEAEPEPVAEELVLLLESLPAPASEPMAEAAAPDRFARTSEDQRAERPDQPSFLGERDTRATSDAPPLADAPALPSQRGVEREGRIETTQSEYQDGDFEPETPDAQVAEAAPPNAPPAVAEAAPPQGEAVPEPGLLAENAATPERPELLQGADPIDLPVPPAVAEAVEEVPLPPMEAREGLEAEQAPAELAEAAEEAPVAPAPQEVRDPAFRGNQERTAVRGSISRTGRSALDVADSPLGRYQAAISRAVEREWQRNCMRHRDFITPGFLSLRFFVDSTGKVRNVQMVGENVVGQVQRGFTLASIHEAEIPPMPAEVARELGGDPLELIYSFYF